MLRSLYITLIFALFLMAGITAPFVFALGYLWVDTFNPQYVSYSILTALPVAQVMAAGAIGGYLLLDGRSPPRCTLITVLTLVLAAWVTLTTSWAVAPDAAWDKWNWAFKTIVFSAFLPFFFRSRIQIESFIQLYAVSLAVHFGPVGLKTLVSGGGYGIDLGVIGGNAGFAEGSTLATACAMLIPLILFLRQHTLLIPRSKWADLGYIGLIVLAVAAVVGTYERTGLIGLLVVGFLSWLRSKRKVLVGAACAIVAAVVIFATSAEWNERMSTIKTYGAESSALTRLLVWQWTLDFAAEHPLGGGFDAYRTDRITFPPTPLEPQGHERKAVAFHSIYFEYLGEQGWVGLGLFAGLVATSFGYLAGVARRTRPIAELQWARDLALALGIALATLLACGAFIGIAFQPMLYYTFALIVCLREHVRRALLLPHSPGARRLPGALAPSPPRRAASPAGASALAIRQWPADG
jgi:putative inorganic carbon (HCO3(-)) transporter